MNHTALIQNLYTAFTALDAEGMVACYHKDVVFKDPAFGELKGDKARNMWRMLIKQSSGKLIVTYGEVKANEYAGFAKWKAVYEFTQTGRKVQNNVSASFEFKDGKIIRHTDHFNLWRWAQQALGWKGLLFGWTPFFKTQLQKQTHAMLASYMENKQSE